MKAYFFDLDGTLTDSRSGLHLSFRAALVAIGARSLSDTELDQFLGTPLPEMFRQLCPAISKRKIVEGIDAFRKVYESEGIRHNRIYPGVTEMLNALHRHGDSVWIVTSKPQGHAEQVIENLHLTSLVSGIVGAGLDEADTKPELVSRALSQAGVAKSDVLLLGDRHYDVEGALQNGILPVGALWGYGTREELSAAGCRDFADSVFDFRREFIDVSGGFMSAMDRMTTAAE